MTLFRTLALAAALTACGTNPCDRLNELHVACGDPPAETSVAACRLTVGTQCNDTDIDRLNTFVDCLEDGLDKDECYISNTKDIHTDPTADCLERHLLDADPACAAARSEL